MRVLNPKSGSRRSCLMVGTALGCAALVAGCGSFPGAGGGTPIRELHLFGVPVAINLDKVPGADGFAVRVFASDGRNASGRPIRSGRLEIVLHDGTPSNEERANLAPLKSWTFEGNRLKEHEARSSIGWGYVFTPAWGDARPAQDRFTVVARWVASDGTVVTSAPSVIAMTVR